MGFPVDDQMAVRSEKCCVVDAIEESLRKHKIQIRGFRKIFIDFQSRIDGGLRPVSEGFSVLWVSWPFNYTEYFSAEPEHRPRLLGAACVAAIQELFRSRQLPIESVNKALSDVQNANFQVESMLGKKLRSPNKRLAACLSYAVTLNDCTVFVSLMDRSGRTLLKEVVTKQPAVFGRQVKLTDIGLSWVLNDAVQVSVKLSRKETIVRDFVLPHSDKRDDTAGGGC